MPGLGRTTAKQLASGGILTLGQLRKANLEEVITFQNNFTFFSQIEKMGISSEVSKWIRGLAWGRDPAEVLQYKIYLTMEENIDVEKFSYNRIAILPLRVSSVRVVQVKMSGKAASIGLEDRFMGIKDREGVREKLAWLIGRLV